MFTAGTPTYRMLLATMMAMALLVIDQRSPWGSDVRYVLGHVVVPVHYVANLPSKSWQTVNALTVGRSDLKEENQRLIRQSLIMEQQVQRLAVLKAENARLRELLNSSSNLTANVLVAEIIGIAPDPNRQEVIINRGRADNVVAGQAVVDAKGIIGQVVDANAMHSRVLLITDISHAMSVQVNRNGVRAILAGTGQSGVLQLLYLPETADVEVGDLLVSTGLGQRYPRGYPVAKVVSIDYPAGASFAEIRALPAAQLDRASHLLVIQPDDMDREGMHAQQ